MYKDIPKDRKVWTISVDQVMSWFLEVFIGHCQKRSDMIINLHFIITMTGVKYFLWEMMI